MASAQGPYQGQKVKGGYKINQTPNFTPEQMNLFQQMFGQVAPGSYLSRLAGGDQSLFQEMEAPALKQFEQQQAQMGSRYSGMGLGAQKSSGFRNDMSQAQADFAGQLQSQRQTLQRQAIMDLMGLSQNLLGQRPYETQLVKPKPKSSGWGGLVGGALGGIGGFMVGGPGGALAGANIGYQAGSAF